MAISLSEILSVLQSGVTAIRSGVTAINNLTTDITTLNTNVTAISTALSNIFPQQTATTTVAPGAGGTTFTSSQARLFLQIQTSSGGAYKIPLYI